jgi:uncharacterized protein (DUF952 family)
MKSTLEHIFHIALTRDWEAARVVGEYRVSTLGATLERVGFIHCSFREQVERIGSLLYVGVSEPITVLEAAAAGGCRSTRHLAFSEGVKLRGSAGAATR